MLEKVTCRKCGGLTPAAPRCLRCGEPLAAPVRGDDAENAVKSLYSAHGQRAHSFLKRLNGMILGNVQFFQYMADGSLPNLKKIAVPEGYQAVVLTDAASETLGPGEHEVGRHGVGSSIRDSLRSEQAGGMLAVCTFPSSHLSTAILLPDWTHIEEAGGETRSGDINLDHNVSMAVTSLSLRTADETVGTAEVTIRLKVADPRKIVTLVARDTIDRIREADPDRVLGTVSTKGPVGAAIAFPFKLLSHAVFGGKGATSPARPVSISLGQIYREFRSELAMAVRAAVRQETVEALYDTIQVRDRIAEDLSRMLAQTLDGFGLSLERITTFKFQSPDYDRVLEERGRLARQKESLKDKRNAAELDGQERAIVGDRRKGEAEDQRDTISTMQQLERHELGEDAQTSELGDAIKAEELARALSRDGQRGEFRRSQVEADRRQELTFQVDAERERLKLEQERVRLQIEKIRMIQALDNEAKDAAQKRRLELESAQIENQRRLLEAAKGESSETILAIALHQHPHLANAFIAAQRAKEATAVQQQQVELQIEFQKQLERAYGQTPALITGLAKEAVRQWGAVKSASAEADRPHAMIKGPGGESIQIASSNPSNG